MKQELHTFTLTINGQTVDAAKGRTLLTVARENNIHIPTLCYHEKLRPLGSCRLCIVEVEGTPTPVSACTTPARPGMQVHTHTEFIENLRRETLKLIFLRHPLNCSACEINGYCQLQDLAHEYDISHVDLHSCGMKDLHFNSEPYCTPLITYHPRRCILCGRCAQACIEITEVGAINYKGRGAEAVIAPIKTSYTDPTKCVSCGECMAACPVHALTETMTPGKIKPWKTDRVRTTCTYCGCGCQIELNVMDNSVIGVTPADGGVNRGALCGKGRFGYGFINHTDRLTSPLIRTDGELKEVSWDTALDYIADQLVHILDTHGPDSIGGLSSARCTNEENYLFQKFMRSVIGTNNVDHCARL